MPCNAIATVTGGVTDESLNRLLAEQHELVAATMTTYLLARLPGRDIEQRAVLGGFCLRVGGYYGIDIFVTNGGEITINTTYRHQVAEAEQLTAELTELLTMTGHQLFEQAVAEFIAENYPVESSQQVGDQLVITFNI